MKNKLVIILSMIFVVVFMFLLVVFIASPEIAKKTKVKVYVFGAEGCPFCDSQIDYLSHLDGLDKKFEIVKKELYIDHIDWIPGADYNLAHKVEDLYKDNNYQYNEKGENQNVDITGTPYVVISNIYAGTGYNKNLESVINIAYNRGHVDVVDCLSKGGTNCFEGEPLTFKDYLPIRLVEILVILTGIYMLVILISIIKKK